MGLTVSEDGRRVSISNEDKSVYAWDLNTGQASLVQAGTGRGFQPDYGKKLIVKSPDGRLVLEGDNDTAVLRHAASNDKLIELKGHSAQILAATFSSDSRMVATGSYDSSVRLWNPKTGEEIKRLDGHLSGVLAVAFSPDDRTLITGGLDGTTRFWEVATGRELCRAIVFLNGDWAVMDPEGRFDASNGGKVEGLHWVANNEPISLSQLKERYYEPGLMGKVLGLNPEPLRDVKTLQNVQLYPEVNYQSPGPGKTKLTIRLKNRGGGIGRIQVFLNGKEFMADARGSNFNPGSMEATLTVDLAGAPSLIVGKANDVRVVAWNVENYVSSRGTSLAWVPSGTADLAPPELYAIIGGISSYSSADLSLSFAAKDAVDIARAIELGAKRLFGADRVHIKLLTNATDPRALTPTKENFRRAFAEARKIKPTDILVVYLAGHGVTLQRGSDTYCYLTQEARTTDSQALADPAVRERTVITSEELTEWTKQIPALKQVLILDTCAAGAAASKLVEKREVSADQKRALERLNDRTGVYVLMGSAADAPSYEASQYGQGLLTYALLQGMKGAALRDDEFIDVNKLFHHAREQVEQLARNIGGIQKPEIRESPNGSFDLGQLRNEDKQVIPLASVKPGILRPRFADPETGDDILDLVKELRKLLRDETFVGVRGPVKQTSLIYFDDVEFPGAIRPTGTYLVTGQAVMVKVFLRREGKTLASFQVDGLKDDVAGVAQKIITELKEAVRKISP
jgi:hypothetical protein